VVTALSSEANASINRIPKPISGSCIFTGDFNIGGFHNVGSGTIGNSDRLNMQLGEVEIVCRCSNEYPSDTFIVIPYTAKEL
jgi:hypothetical protein